MKITNATGVMDDSGDYEDIRSSLVQMGLLAPAERFTYTNLTGGVSCDVWKVEIGGRDPIVVKRALPKLRVAADWHAPPERSVAEVAWLKLARTMIPDNVPAIVGEDPANNIFAMAYLEPLHHPLWKTELAAGRVEVDFARAVGEKLALVHAGTAWQEDIAKAFDNGMQFHALRLDAYLYHAAARNLDVAPKISTVARGIAKARIALMHGDISPKNILRGPGGPIFLDAETACYGDPVFDLAFCLNHLLLKCVWHPEYRDAYLQSFRALRDGYMAFATWERKDGIQARTARLLAILLLARVDGKSPVEYLTDPRDTDFVRQAAKNFIKSGTEDLELIASAWEAGLSALVTR
jgi:5-methylthioribose kinase